MKGFIIFLLQENDLIEIFHAYYVRSPVQQIFSWKPILDNIERRFESYLEQENQINRKNIVDERIHACLYFVAPNGHCLKSVDVEFMLRFVEIV